IVKPGGTGRAALVISARPAPLPPSSSFILPLPSALPAPKKKTYCVPVCGCMAALVSGLEIGVTLIWLVSIGMNAELQAWSGPVCNLFILQCADGSSERRGENSVLRD